MANEWLRKSYTGAAVATTLNGAIAGGAGTIVVANGTTYPDGSGGPFVICIDRGLPTEEKVIITSRIGASMTVLQRGYDGTAAQGHANAAPVEHCLDGWSVDQANAMAAAAATVGQVPYRSGALTYAGATPGTAGRPLVSGGALAAPVFATLEVAGLSAAALEILCPAGTIRETCFGTADSGWALMGTTIVGANVSAPTLFSKVPIAWKSGNDIILPSMTDRMLRGSGATALGATGGANTKTIAQANLPAVGITIDPPATALGGGFTAIGPSAGVPLVGSGTGPATYFPTTDIAPFTSGNLGSGTALDVANAHLAVVYQIKAH